MRDMLTLSQEKLVKSLSEHFVYSLPIVVLPDISTLLFLILVVVVSFDLVSIPLSVPVRGPNGAHIGVLEALNSRNQPSASSSPSVSGMALGGFTEEDETLFRSMATNICTVIQARFAYRQERNVFFRFP